MALFTIVVVATFLWIAVAWHRFVLNNERPRLIPAFHGPEMLRYLGRSIKITLLVFLIGILLNFLFVLVVKASNSAVLTIILAFAVQIILTVIGQGLPISLPAMALGENVTLSEGWKAT